LKIFTLRLCRRFLLQFVSTSGSYERGVGNLNIIETNPFKHLTHLSLRFLPGNDTEVKKYLADCLKKFKVGQLQNERPCVQALAMRRTVATQFFLQASQSDSKNCCKQYDMENIFAVTTEWVHVQMYVKTNSRCSIG